MMTQRKMKAQPPLSDAYLHGMPAKRRKVMRSVAISRVRRSRRWSLSPSWCLSVSSDRTEWWEPPLPL